MDGAGGSLNQGSNGDHDDTHSSINVNVPSVLPGKHTRVMPKKRRKGGVGSRTTRGGNTKSQSTNNHPTAPTPTPSISVASASKEATNKQLQQKLCDRDETIRRLKESTDIVKELSRTEVSNPYYLHAQ